MKILSVFIILFGLISCTLFKPKCSDKSSCEKQESCNKKEMKDAIAYEGNCAMGMCLKKKVNGKPDYKVDYKNRCYIFSSAEARDKFLSSIDENIKQADLHWQQLGIDRLR